MADANISQHAPASGGREPPDRLLGEAGLLRRIEELTRALQGLPDTAARQVTQELAQAILAYHAAGLSRLLTIIRNDDQSGAPMIAALADDPLVGSLLLLHDLHPTDLRSRLAGALAAVQSTLGTHRVAVEVTEASSQLVRLRLRSTAPGGLPPAALHRIVEEAVIAAAPDVATIEFDNDNDAAPRCSPLLPILNLSR